MMKKTKKILLWSIVPILGASGAIAGVVAGTATNSTTIVSTNTTEDSVSGNNSASSSVESNPTNESNSSASTGTSASSGTATSSSGSNTTTSTSTSTATNLKITYLAKNVVTFSESSANVVALATSKTTNIKYRWYVNKNDGQGWSLSRSSGIGSVQIDAPKTDKVLSWTFICKVTDETTKESVASDEVQFTILPNGGRNISVATQPTSSLTTKGGETVTLSTSAVGKGSGYTSKTIGYQWFKYNSTSGQYVEVAGATSATYSFKAGYYGTDTVEKYLCRYYFTDDSKKVYLNESNVSTVTVEATKKPEEQVKISSLKATSTSINSGEKTTLSVSAESNLTNSLTYQWYKASANGEFTQISGANSSTYEYTGDSVESATDVIFMVMVKGKDYCLQSSNLVVRVNPVGASTEVETPSKELTVKATVVQNQAPVNDKFQSWATITGYWYGVEVTAGATSSDKITYQWYYAGADGIEHEISGAKESTLTPNTELFKNIYNNNSSHRAQLICKVYKNGKLSNVVDQSTFYKFYMSVGIVTRG